MAPKRRLTKADRNLFYSRLISLPVELLSMVLGFVHPRTLLMVARSSRQFRGLLTKRSSRVVWISCIGHAGIPACPVDLEEITYVSLVYQPMCSYCYGIAHNVYWVWQVRCCSRCLPTRFVSPTSPVFDKNIYLLLGMPSYYQIQTIIQRGPFYLICDAEMRSMAKCIHQLKRSGSADDLAQYRQGKLEALTEHAYHDLEWVSWRAENGTL